MDKPNQVAPTFQEKIYTDEELALIKDIYKNPKNLKILRKVFNPSYDYDAPLGQAFDLMTIFPFEQYGITERSFYTEVRRSVIKHIEQRLMDLYALANTEEESEADTKTRQDKDSTK